MDRREFKRKLELHKTQTGVCIKELQKGFEDLNERNFEFYEFIESSYYDLEERLTQLESEFQKLG